MSFRVPEPSRNTWHPMLATTEQAGKNGAFDLPSCEPGWRLAIIASDGNDVPELSAKLGQWEHVSVHAYATSGREKTRTPNWREMCLVKATFWEDEDVVVQYHPRRSEYVNQHPNVLHLWRPVGVELPTPPPIYVGIQQGVPK